MEAFSTTYRTGDVQNQSYDEAREERCHRRNWNEAEGLEQDRRIQVVLCLKTWPPPLQAVSEGHGSKPNQYAVVDEVVFGSCIESTSPSATFWSIRSAYLSRTFDQDR